MHSAELQKSVVVSVAIGSVFARALTATDVALLETVLAFFLLIALQYTLG